MEIASGNWRILYLALSIFNYTFCGFSSATATAISVDRLLALLLGIRYRRTLTLRRVPCFVVCFLPATIVTGFIYSLSSRDFANSAGFVVIITSLFSSVFSYAKIFFKLRQHRAQLRQHAYNVGHEQANGRGIPLNIEMYKKIVCTIAWVQLALVFCYFPVFVLVIVSIVTTTDWYKLGSIFHISALIVVYFNSTLNPIPFCWKIREVRETVKTTLKQICCFSS